MKRTAKIVTPVEDNGDIIPYDDPANRDILTGEPGSHPIATGIGAAAGVTAGVGAAIALGATSGAALGPAGAVIGAIAGGIFGGGVGHQIGEDIFPTELGYWKENYHTRPYVKLGTNYSQYEPAYWYGVDAALRNPQHEFDALEPNIRNNWNIGHGTSTLQWDEARAAARDAFTRTRQEYSAKK